MRNHSIKLPRGCNKDDVVIAFFNASHQTKEAGYEATARSQNAYAWEIDAMNPEPADVDLSDDADDNEIAVYLKADEIKAIQWALERVTFGDLDEIHSTVLHSAMKEIRQTSLR